MDRQTHIHLSIIIPSFNRKEKLLALLNSLRSNEAWKNQELAIVCVIDGSTDGTIEALYEHWPQIHIVRGDGNWWYTRCINEGISYASNSLNPDMFMIMNDDIIVKERFVDKMMQLYRNRNEDCLVGCISLTIEDPKRVTFSGVYKNNSFPWSMNHILPHMTEVNEQDLQGIKQSYHLPGRTVIFSNKVYQETGGLDNEFPQYHSDADFSRRAAHKGFPSYVTWDIPIFSHHLLSGGGLERKKTTWKQFRQDLFYLYGRRNLRQNIRYIWRHEHKVFFPFFITKWFLAICRNYLFTKKA